MVPRNLNPPRSAHCCFKEKQNQRVKWSHLTFQCCSPALQNCGKQNQRVSMAQSHLNFCFLLCATFTGSKNGDLNFNWLTNKLVQFMTGIQVPINLWFSHKLQTEQLKCHFCPSLMLVVMYRSTRSEFQILKLLNE